MILPATCVHDNRYASLGVLGKGQYSVRVPEIQAPLRLSSMPSNTQPTRCPSWTMDLSHARQKARKVLQHAATAATSLNRWVFYDPGYHFFLIAHSSKIYPQHQNLRVEAPSRPFRSRQRTTHTLTRPSRGLARLRVRSAG